MNQSEHINELASALIKVQANLKPAERDGDNPFFHSTYATLSSVWDVCRKPLADNGIAVIQPPSSETLDTVTVQTILVHTSGQWISGSLSMKPQKNDPQSIGSIVSYFRRYLLASMVGICVEDDDAEGAMDRKEAPKTNGKPYNGQQGPRPQWEKPKTTSTNGANISHFKDVLKNHQEFFGEHAWKKYFTSKKGEIPTLEQIYQWRTPAQLDWLGRSLERMEKELFASKSEIDPFDDTANPQSGG